MHLSILKNDLRRKKSVNLILTVFIILAAMLMGGSSSVLFSTTTAVDHMLEKSNVPDMSIYTFDQPDVVDAVEAWADTSDKVESYRVEDALLMMISAFSRDGRRVVGDKDLVSTFLVAVPETDSKIFNQDNQALELSPGEIAIPMGFHKTYDLKIGDTLDIVADGKTTSFVISAYSKDVVFGSDMISLKRFVIHADDFSRFHSQESLDLIKNKIWSVNAKEGVSFEALSNDFSRRAVTVITTIDIATIRQTYLVPMLIATVMIVVSVSLILIAFLILRFTIVFTIQEDYREIGVMKGIGIRNKVVRRIYRTKYLAIALFGGLVGFGLSFIYSNIMMRSLNDLFMMDNGVGQIVFTLIGSALVVGLSMLFSSMCTRKINKVSVVEAIRKGNTGERFSKSKRLSLYTKKSLRAPGFLALSDIFNGFRKFLVLALTFTLGTLLIIVPLNMINTLKDKDEMMKIFGMPPHDVTMMTERAFQVAVTSGQEAIEEEIQEMQNASERAGYPVDLHLEIGYSANIFVDEPDEGMRIDVLQGIRFPIEDYDYSEGRAPIRENEIAVSTMVAETLNLQIGDTVSVQIGQEEYAMLVTAKYSSINNMGMNIRAPETFVFTITSPSTISIIGTFETMPEDLEKAAAAIKAQNPNISISFEEDEYQRYIGGTVESIDGMKNLIVVVVLSIIFLITCLIVRMLISREISQIALLKSIGFRCSSLSRWQIGRISIILVLSVAVGTALSLPLSHLLTGSIFGMLGASSVTAVIEPLQVYAVYPLIFLVSTITAVVVSIGQIKQTPVSEINSQE